MEVNPDKGLNVGPNPFYQPVNTGYGTNWQSSQGQNPIQVEDAPLYNEIVSSYFFTH